MAGNFTKFALAAAALLCLGATPSTAQDYPNDVIRIVHGSVPGGSLDNLSRRIGESLENEMAANVVVEPTPGANGTLSAAKVAEAAPDGYTLLVATNPQMVVNPLLYSNMSIKPMEELQPIAILGGSGNILIVNPDSPYQTLDDLMAEIKARPGELICGSGGAGSLQHLSCELFERLLGAELVHVPYKGGAPTRTDLMGGHIDMHFSDLAGLPLIRDGKLRALAYTASERSPSAPEVPTFAELGVPELQVQGFFIIAAPIDTPKDVIAKLSDALAKVVESEEYSKFLLDQGLTPPGVTTPEEVTESLLEEGDKWAAVIKEAGIKLE